MAHPTPRLTAAMPQPSPAPALFRGVYDVDVGEMPTPPLGARAVIVVDSKGVVIGAAWVVAEQASDLDGAAWNWLDQRDVPPSPRPSLHLL